MSDSRIESPWLRLRQRVNHVLRRTLLPVFARANPGDITIRHHHTGDPVRLHSFRHKGYWWYGKQRESASMALFSELIGAGDVVFDVGSHIGYVALYFSKLVGSQGRVFAFEPGPNNLPYTRRNVSGKSNITLVAKALSNHRGTDFMFVESLTGQNNSMVRNFEGLRANEREAFRARVAEVAVEILPLDDFVRDEHVVPSFIKIDVEGYELEVLEGARSTLGETKPRLMVEVQRNHDAIYSLLSEFGYDMFSEDRSRVERPSDLRMNTFCLNRDKDAALISKMMRR